MDKHFELVDADEEKNQQEQETSHTTEENVDPSSFSDLYKYADFSDKISLGVGCFLAWLSGVNQPAQLIVFGSLLNSFNVTSTDQSTQKVEFLALMYLILGIQMLITQFLQTSTMTYAAGKQIKKIREAYFAALLRQNIAFFDEKNQGVLATSVMESTQIIQDGLGEKLALGIQFGSSFVFGLGVALYYVWPLALLLLAVIPVIAIALAGFMALTSSNGTIDAYNAAGSAAQEALGAIRTVFAFGSGTQYNPEIVMSCVL